MNTTRLLVTLYVLALSAVASAAPPATAPATQPARTIRVFLLSGQSNAGGAGNGDELPADLRQTDPEVLLLGRAQKGELRPLAPYHRFDAKFHIEHTAFGPELAFAKEIKKTFPQDIICIAKHTQGGCSIVAWDKNWQRADWKDDLKAARNETKEPQYEPMLAVLNDAIRQVKGRFPGLPVVVSGVVWVQSERDDTSRQSAEKYEPNLRALIQNLRDDLKSPDLPFLFADANIARYEEIIRPGMQKVAKEVPRTSCIPIAGLPKHEGIHYNTEGQLELGRRFARAYLEMVKQP